MKALILVHRWLGIAFGLLFVAWFASGIAMMYARMPGIAPNERLARAETLLPDALALTPHEAAAKLGLRGVDSVQLAMLRGRPVYRLPGAPTTTVFADTGLPLAPLDQAEALDVVRRFAPEHAQRARDDGLLEEADQWTLQSRQHLPLQRIALGDADDTRLYVSRKSGEVVMKTTRRERLLAYLGPVLHWLYFPALRRNGPLWNRVIVWSSGVGCVLCLAGLLIGLLRFWRARSPYAGLLRWHHLLGLAFGLITLTWTFSGLLSMGPWPGLSNPGITKALRRAISGSAPPIETLTLPGTKAAAAALLQTLPLKQMTLVPFRGELYWLGEGAAGDSALVSATSPERGVFRRFANEDVQAVARDAMPGVRIEEAVWLARSDVYYYDRRGARPLPVLRVRYADSDRTWLYFDPRRGALAMASSPGGRLNRWLYHGLHSLDFPLLYPRRPLWDIVVIALSLGGLALAATTLLPGWRRLRDRVRPLLRS